MFCIVQCTESINLTDVPSSSTSYRSFPCLVALMIQHGVSYLKRQYAFQACLNTPRHMQLQVSWKSTTPLRPKVGKCHSTCFTSTSNVFAFDSYSRPSYFLPGWMVKAPWSLMSSKNSNFNSHERVSVDPSNIWLLKTTNGQEKKRFMPSSEQEMHAQQPFLGRLKKLLPNGGYIISFYASVKDEK